MSTAMRLRQIGGMFFSLISGIAAVALMIVSGIDTRHDYFGLFLIFSIPGSVVAVGALFYSLRRRLPLSDRIALAAWNGFALCVWGFWIGLFVFIMILSYQPREWRAAYNQISPGMALAEVERVLDPLEPQFRETRPLPDPEAPGAPEDARRCLFYVGANGWHYYIYFDSDDKVLFKWKRWD